jgi:hypothetical protein
MAADHYLWRNVERKRCQECGRVHRFLTKACLPILFTEEYIRYERRLFPGEFVKQQSARQISVEEIGSV